jgi:hypothetical protein
LTLDHFPRCQPNLTYGKSGFLKIGSQPEKNAHELRRLLEAVGTGL